MPTEDDEILKKMQNVIKKKHLGLTMDADDFVVSLNDGTGTSYKIDYAEDK